MIYHLIGISSITILFSIFTFHSAYAYTLQEKQELVNEMQIFLDEDIDYREINKIENDESIDNVVDKIILSIKEDNYGEQFDGDTQADEKFLKAIIRDKTEVIGTYVIGKKRYPIYSLAQWKFDIMDEMGLKDAQKIHYLIINSLECGRDDGFCKSRSDSGFFQINQIHRTDWNKSNILIKEKKSDELFRFQLKWTFDRLESYKKRLCNKGDTDSIFRCMMKVHNGNNRVIGTNGYRFKDYYAEKGMTLKRSLVSIIESSQVTNNITLK